VLAIVVEAAAFNDLAKVRSTAHRRGSPWNILIPKGLRTNRSIKKFVNVLSRVTPPVSTNQTQKPLITAYEFRPAVGRPGDRPLSDLAGAGVRGGLLRRLLFLRPAGMVPRPLVAAFLYLRLRHLRNAVTRLLSPLGVVCLLLLRHHPCDAVMLPLRVFAAAFLFLLRRLIREVDTPLRRLVVGAFLPLVRLLVVVLVRLLVVVQHLDAWVEYEAECQRGRRGGSGDGDTCRFSGQSSCSPCSIGPRLAECRTSN
jgi:hypothetical protein